MQPAWSDDSLFDRRQWLKYGALLGSTLGGLAASGQAGTALPSPATSLQRSGRQYPMRKSINLWAFPYPAKMTLKECFELARRAGYDAVEVNYNLEGDLSPAAGEKELAGDPHHGRQGRHCHQRGLLLSLLAISTHRQ